MINYNAYWNIIHITLIYERKTYIYNYNFNILNNIFKSEFLRVFCVSMKCTWNNI